MSAELAAPTVPLRSPAERKLRFGPFPSMGDAMRFAGYAAAGSLVIPWLGAVAWLPFVAIGFVLVVWQPGGTSLDARLVARARAWERAFRPREAGVSRRGTGAHGAFARLESGGIASVLKCPGRPIAFLPPRELEARFQRYRALLRALPGSVVIVGTGVPVDPKSWLPPEGGEGARDDLEARKGYGEMVALLCRRRRLRRVYLLQGVPAGTGNGAALLSERTTALETQLQALDLAPVRLEGTALTAALARFGFGEPRSRSGE